MLPRQQIIRYTSRYQLWPKYMERPSRETRQPKIRLQFDVLNAQPTDNHTLKVSPSPWKSKSRYQSVPFTRLLRAIHTKANHRQRQGRSSGGIGKSHCCLRSRLNRVANTRREKLCGMNDKQNSRVAAKGQQQLAQSSRRGLSRRFCRG